MATRLNITIEQGSTFSLTFDVNDADGTPFDLDGHTVTGQMRKHYNTTNAAISFTTGIANTNEITLSLTATQTADIVADKYVYDIEMDDGSNTITRVVEGVVYVTPEVTRS